MINEASAVDLLGSLTDEEYFVVKDWVLCYDSVREWDHDGTERLSLIQAIGRRIDHRLGDALQPDKENLLDDFLNLLLEEIKNE
jgi:hypothetical protein